MDPKENETNHKNTTTKRLHNLLFVSVFISEIMYLYLVTTLFASRFIRWSLIK